MPEIPALQCLGWKDGEFKASLGDIAKVLT